MSYPIMFYPPIPWLPAITLSLATCLVLLIMIWVMGALGITLVKCPEQEHHRRDVWMGNAMLVIDGLICFYLAYCMFFG